MCLAIPSKITHIDGQNATIDVTGVQREVSLMLLENAQVGEYVIVHAGFAIQKLDEASALETLDLLRQAADAAFQDESAPDESAPDEPAPDESAPDESD